MSGLFFFQGRDSSYALFKHGADGQARVDAVYGLAEEWRDGQDGNFGELLLRRHGYGLGDDDLFYR